MEFELISLEKLANYRGIEFSIFWISGISKGEELY